MTIEWLRDLVIVILGILSILVTIALLVVLVIAFRKIKTLVDSVNRYVLKIHKWLAYARGLARGLSESINVFKKEGG